MCMQFILDKIPSKMFSFTTCLLLLVILFRKATNSAGLATQSDSAQHRLDKNSIGSKPLAFKELYSLLLMYYNVCERVNYSL